MDPALIAILALIASAIQVGILRAIDYYFPRGHTHTGDQIAETRAEREERHKKLFEERRKTIEHEDDDYEIDDSES
jgi:hypothetical protein